MAEIFAGIGAAVGAMLLSLVARCLYQRLQEAGNCRFSCSSDEKDGCGCSCLSGKPKTPPAPTATADPPAAQTMSAPSSLSPTVPRSRFTKRDKQKQLRASNSSIDLDRIVQRQILHSMVRNSQAGQAAQAMLIKEEKREQQRQQQQHEQQSTNPTFTLSTGSSNNSTATATATTPTRDGDETGQTTDAEPPRIPLREVVRHIVEQRRRNSKERNR